MDVLAPKIDRRKLEDLIKQIRAMAPFYTPEWIATFEKEPGMVLVKIFSTIFEQIIVRLNQVPDKNRIAFLDMLGVKLLPAQSAVVPVTFSLSEGAIDNVFVPQGTQLTAMAADESEEIVFETQKNLMISAALLKEVFSIDSSKDKVYEHSAKVLAGNSFELFTGIDAQEHAIYIGHLDLFNQKRPATITINFLFTRGAKGSEALEFAWEYWNGNYWVGLANVSADDGTDTTSKFQKNGFMKLEKEHFGEIATKIIQNFESRWIRCRIKTDKSPLNYNSPIQLPIINTIRIGVIPKDYLTADLTFNNDIPIDVESIDIKMLALCQTEFLFEYDGETLNLDAIMEEAEVGDFLEFDNWIDDPERREITPELSSPPDILLSARLNNIYPQGSTVRIVTAIRKGDFSVTIESSDAINVKTGNKVLLVGDKIRRETNYIQSCNPVLSSPPEAEEKTKKYVIGFKNKILNSYLEGDLLKIIPSIKPFGEVPRLFDTFYIASDEAFSKKGATITLVIEARWSDCDAGICSPLEQEEPKPVLSWEYWNGKSWRGIRIADYTNCFREDGSISFICPKDIEKIKVNGEEKYWIRARIIDGDYGKEIILKDIGSTDTKVMEGTIHYPIITELKINYEEIEREPQFCLTSNNLKFEDRTKECIDVGSNFIPYETLIEPLNCILLGFSSALTGGPLKLYFWIKEQILPANTRIKMQWSYWNGNKWDPITVDDQTNNLTKSGLLEWVGSRDFTSRELFTKKRYWLKASIIEGTYPENPQIFGIFPNTTLAFQAFSVANEILGSSNGTANLKFNFLKLPVISQDIWIKEPNLPDADEQLIITNAEGKEAILQIKNETGETQEIWIRWHQIDDFDQSDSTSRHYTIDQRLGIIQFGDGEKGMIPPIDTDNIKANYKYGGGLKGNIAQGAISGLKNAIAFVKDVKNYQAADGGSETEILNQALLRGPQSIKNQARAVTEEDFEWLARCASRKVVRAKCLANTDNNGNFVPGWITMLIVPDSQEDKPALTYQLRTIVMDKLLQQCATSISAHQHLYVREPDYVEVVVKVTVVPVSSNVAAEVENNIYQALKRYINPLTGGPNHDGWEFGKNICLTKIYALIEGIPNVNFVEDVVLYADGKKQKQDIALEQFTLPYSGDHEIILKMKTSETSKLTNVISSECVEAS